MKIVALQTVYYQIDGNILEQVEETAIFSEQDTFAKLNEWACRKIGAYFRSPVIQLTVADEP